MRRSAKTHHSARVLGVLLAALLGLTACGGSRGENRQPYTIAGGNTSGVYYDYGKHLADAVRRDTGIDIDVAETQGSVENLERVGLGEALVGFAQGDTAADAVLGRGSFADPLPVRAVARVYDEYVHVVVPADSDVRDVTDLADRTVSLGAESSGVQVIALRVLDGAGVDRAAVLNVGLGLDDSIDAMQRGEIEAFFWVGGLPTPGIERLVAAMPIRLLSIGADVVDQVNEGHTGVYQLADFPVGFYNLGEPTVTMTVPNYLIAAESAPDELIHDVLRVLFESRASISRSVTAAGYLDRRQAIFTGPIELHPGAVQYYTAMRN